ncbi:MAG: hypothetical protein JO204_20315 [Alphaproteobacteria bacterium]|nr:hypothetical protein [Alphaproteobacteria bacterium]
MIVIALLVAAEPSIFRIEAEAESIANVRPVIVPVRSSVPPEAVIVPEVEIEIATIP